VAGSGLALATGCSGRHGDAPRLANADELSPGERLYGLAPHRDADVVYQPDVMIVGDGARSIIARSSDGLVWGIDSGARNLHRVREGQILFVTGNCVGRVLGMRREGDVTAVVLGPVELTEVFRECRIEFEQPFDPGQASALAAPDFPGAQMTIGDAIPGGDHDMPDPSAMSWPAPGEREPTWQRAALADGGASRTSPLSFKVEPILDANTIGLRANAWNQSVDVLFNSQLRLRNASLSFFLDLSGAKVRMARVSLDAALELRMGFSGKAQESLLANIDRESQMVPLDLHLPVSLGTGGIGLGVSLQHQFLVKTAFSARNSWYFSLGHWDLSGGLVMHYQDGAFRRPPKKEITHTREGIMDNMLHASVGVTGMVLAHRIRLMVGIGAGGFRAGPFIGCNSAIGLFRGSNITQPVQPQVCRGATLAMGLQPGVGYEIPRIVAEALNFFLRALRINEIKPAGGIMSKPVRVLTRTHYSPDNDFCREAAGPSPV
jgi:hypothetical protein